MKILLAAVILAHSWYPPECCNGEEEHGDCRPVPCSSLEFKPGNPGWVMHEGHWIISDEVRQSPDGQCHVCEQPNHERMYCAWMPMDLS